MENTEEHTCENLKMFFLQIWKEINKVKNCKAQDVSVHLYYIILPIYSIYNYINNVFYIL